MFFSVGHVLFRVIDRFVVTLGGWGECSCWPSLYAVSGLNSKAALELKAAAANSPTRVSPSAATEMFQNLQCWVWKLPCVDAAGQWCYTGAVVLAHDGNESRPNMKRPQVLMARLMQPIPMMFITTPDLTCGWRKERRYHDVMAESGWFSSPVWTDSPYQTLLENRRRRRWHWGVWLLAAWRRRMRSACRGSSHTEGSGL